MAIYGSTADPRVRERVIEALFVQDNAQQLVALTRKETNPELKKAAVSAPDQHAQQGSHRLPDGAAEQMTRRRRGHALGA